MLLTSHCKLIFISVVSLLIVSNTYALDLGRFFDKIKEEIVDLSKDVIKALKNVIGCEACEHICREIIEDHKNGESFEQIAQFLSDWCDTLNLQTPEVCNGIVRLNLPLLLDIVKEKDLNEQYVCKTILEYQNCFDGLPAVQWSLDLDKYGPKPTSCPPINTQGLSQSCNKIIHMTDLHWDQKYVAGSSALCEEPICCRNSELKPEEELFAATEFGHYNKCDVPLNTLESVLNHIKDTYGSEICFMYLTGDMVAHTVWDTSQDEVITSITTQMELLRKHLPNTAFYVSTGNHDMHPTNQFADPNHKDYTNWQYELMIDQWADWLDDDARATIRRGGYYTYLAPNGIRIVSLNSIFCYVLNWWTIFEPRDISGQLMWLADVLYDAEQNGEPVHIIMHINSGNSDCLREYSREIWRIYTRFHCTIKGIFAGHLHLDQTQIIYDIETLSEPLISVFNGGSITSFEDVNPNFKLYELDTTTMEVINAESWILNLDDIPDTSKWTQLYSFKDEFQIESTRPQDLDKLIHKLAKDKDLMKKYNWFYAKGANTAIVNDCDDDCLKELLCFMVTADYSNLKKCEQLEFDF